MYFNIPTPENDFNGKREKHQMPENTTKNIYG